MKRLLPKEFEILDAYLQVLPGKDCPPFTPFLSIAININVA